jgi:hypothetical protein
MQNLSWQANLLIMMLRMSLNGQHISVLLSPMGWIRGGCGNYLLTWLVEVTSSVCHSARLDYAIKQLATFSVKL